MREPGFWHRPPSLLSTLLAPFGVAYGAIAARRMARRGLPVGVPVLCVGNYTQGGAGKTPTVLALCALLRALDERPVVLSRGYGGRLNGPVAVDRERHTAADVGDEPLMMAARADVVVARDRIEGAALARAKGASVVVMDDGFQNPSLARDASIVVIDSHRALGNGRVFPAGPLRAPLPDQIARTDALLVIGDGKEADPVAERVEKRGGLVLRGALAPDASHAQALSGRRVLAFAGIGDPPRFFRTLAACGADVMQRRAFADHHCYRVDELRALRDEARRGGLLAVTTEKDMARIASDPALAEMAGEIATLAVTLALDDEAALRRFVLAALDAARAPR